MSSARVIWANNFRPMSGMVPDGAAMYAIRPTATGHSVLAVLCGARCPYSVSDSLMYGDSYLNIHFRLVYEAFCRSGLPALMTVFRNEGCWDSSNVEFADGVIRCYDKADRTPAMRHIDYGLGGFEAHVVRACPANTPFDLADLYRDLVQRRLLAGCEVHQRFYEIGSPAGLAETDAFLRRVSAARGDG